jgi:hypothetical protein
MNLRGIRSRLDELLAAHAEENEPPSTIVLLPENGRGPASDAPYPRVERVGQAAVITYLIADGQPSADDIARLLAGVQP